jgi:predicted metal-binding membrane protein
MRGTAVAAEPSSHCGEAGERSAAPEGVRRSRLRLQAPAALLFAVSLAATIWFSRSMSATMPMPGGWTMSMVWMRMPGQDWWGAAAMFLAMWLAMMVAMMLPSALPMFRRSRSPLLFGTGYFTLWTALGVPVYLLGAAGAAASMRWSWISRMFPLLAGSTVLLAGLHQLTSRKMAALGHCRVPPPGEDPSRCAAESDSGGRARAVRAGLRCGASCAACCSGYMLILLVTGMMSLATMSVLAVLIALEKLAPRPERVVRLSGFGAILAGVVILARALAPIAFR